MHCLSALALISYPDLTLFFGRGRSGCEITQAPLLRVSVKGACSRFSDCGRGAGRWEQGFKKALPLPLFLIISSLSHFAFHSTIRTPGIGCCKRRLSNFVKILTKLIPSMFHKSPPQTDVKKMYHWLFFDYFFNCNFTRHILHSMCCCISFLFLFFKYII